MDQSTRTSIQPGENKIEDAQILAAQNDPALFEPLYDRWVAPVYRYLLSCTADPADAEDLTSQVFLAAYQNLSRYQHKGQFAAWLFTIARNQARTYFRIQRRSVPLDTADIPAAPGDLLLESVRKEEIARLKELVARLNEDEQELIRLRYLAELSFAEMAVVLKRREDAVKKSLYRLQARLQSLLENPHA